MNNQPTNVFFDASILIPVGAPPGKETFQRLVDLVQLRFITVVTTDLTKTEIARHHTDQIFERLQPMATPRFRDFASRYFTIDIPRMSDTEMRKEIRRQIMDGVESMFESLDAHVLDIDEVRPSVIFDAYDRGDGLFVKQNKKNQFPDAFIFERLKKVASEESPLLIVAHDSDFEEVAHNSDHVTLVDSISGLFCALGLLVDEPDPDLEPFLYHDLLANIDFLNYVERVDWQMDEYKLSTICESIKIHRIHAFQQVKENAPLLVSANVSVDLNVKLEYNGGGPTEIHYGEGIVSFYASVVTDHRGEPIEITDLRAFECSLKYEIRH